MYEFLDVTSTTKAIVPMFGPHGNRQEMLIVATLLEDALAAGYAVSVDDGGDEYAVEDSTSLQEICAALFETDEATLWFSSGGAWVGFVYLIHGNSPGEVIADHTANDLMRALVARAGRLAAHHYYHHFRSVHVSFGRADAPTCNLGVRVRYGWDRQSIRVDLRADWYEAVYLRGYADLPLPLRTKRILVLHVGAEMPSAHIGIAPAQWTEGGSKVKTGFIAVRREYWSQQIIGWAVGTTPNRAVLKMQRLPPQPASAPEGPVSPDDADAMGEAFL